MVVYVAPFAGAWIEIQTTADSYRAMFVAPFAGAWIEIIKCTQNESTFLSLPSRERGLKFSAVVLSFFWAPCRSLRGSVDWNLPVIGHIDSNHPGRSLRGSVDWNPNHYKRVNRDKVAPFAGAWIEIQADLRAFHSSSCRSLRGSVDWNTRVITSSSTK